MINKFRIEVLDGQTDAIKLLSTLDPTHSLTRRTDEECVIGKDDLVVLKNLGETPCKVRLTGHEHDRECGRTVFRPSRQSSFTLWDGKVWELILGPGESCPIRCERAQLPRSPLPVIAA